MSDVRKLLEDVRSAVRPPEPGYVVIIDHESLCARIDAALAAPDPRDERIAELEKDAEAAREEYSKSWTPHADDSIADLMRAVCVEATYQHERFKKRGAELDAADERIAALEAALTNCLEIFGDAEWEYGDGTPFDVKAVRAALGGSTTLAAHDAEVRWAALEEALRKIENERAEWSMAQAQAPNDWHYPSAFAAVDDLECAIRALAAKEKP